MKNKIYTSATETISDIQDGDSIMVGGFAARGTPSNLLLALRDKGVKDLIITRNDACGGWKNPNDVNVNFEAGQAKKCISCFPVFGSPKKVSELEKKVNEGVTEIELVPQGTLAERIRCGGAGIGAFYTPVGVGTDAAKGKDVRMINGEEMVLEYALRAKFAFIKAYKADKMGNLVYRKTTRNFNPIMAMAADITIVETENLVEVGEIDPEDVVTPSIFVDRIFEVSE